MGSVQIIRYRAAGCKLPPKKTHKSALTFYKDATKYDARAKLGDNAANGDVIKHQNEQWKALDAATRRPYEALAEADRAHDVELARQRKLERSTLPGAAEGDLKQRLKDHLAYVEKNL